MCGITGIVDRTRSLKNDDLDEQISMMSSCLAHRGPDSSGKWIDPSEGIALGFRRLAILDLSSQGNQPMISSDGRFIILLNGEIYNFSSLREKLIRLGHTFKSSTDTEIILAGIMEWGPEEAVTHFNGMFSIALWDRVERKLFLIRDRLGVKPLYYGWVGKIFVFGSELKALVAHPNFQNTINQNSLALYLKHSNVPSPHSIYEGIKKVLPGHMVIFSPREIDEPLMQKQYWSLEKKIIKGRSEPYDGTRKEAISDLDELISESVRLRMVADVPVGAFLSGGVDSSLIAAMMQRHSSEKVKTYSIGFHEKEYNEANFAKQIAQHLGTDHTEFYITPKIAKDVISKLPEIYDEPFSDSSQIPTYMVSKIARNDVAVCLTGEGGDELFGGYDWYTLAPKIWASISWIPLSVRNNIFKRFAESNFSKNIFRTNLTKNKFESSINKMQKYMDLFNMSSADETYFMMRSIWKYPGELLKNNFTIDLNSNRGKIEFSDDKFMDRMMYWDSMSYMPDDIFTKVDRASMAVSLEVRVPLVDDHNIVEFAWRLPRSMKINMGGRKWILRQVLNRYVPRELTERKKMGFNLPIGKWLKNDLRDWGEELLNKKRLESEGYFHSEIIRKKWDEHQLGIRNWHQELWGILMFQMWLDKSKKSF